VVVRILEIRQKCYSLSYVACPFIIMRVVLHAEQEANDLLYIIDETLLITIQLSETYEVADNVWCCTKCSKGPFPPTTEIMKLQMLGNSCICVHCEGEVPLLDASYSILLVCAPPFS
jgi:hypothetical protein